MSELSPSDHGSSNHVHDDACAAAHGEVVLPRDPRTVVVVFASPVAHEIGVLAARLGWPVMLLDPVAGNLDGAQVPTTTVVDNAELDARTDVVFCDHGRPELGDLLAEVLRHPTRWVGVMGSARHTAPHIEALRSRGVDEATIARVHRPIGLDIGSHTPVEIAISTVAGLLADRNGRPGGFPTPPPAVSPLLVTQET